MNKKNKNMKNRKSKSKKSFSKPKKFSGKKSGNSSGSSKVLKEFELVRTLDYSSKGEHLVRGRVNRVVQTGGPTIFVISDGSGSLQLKGFEGPGQRAYPEIDEGDLIKARIKIEEFQGEVEGDISKISKLDDSEKEDFEKSINELEKKRAEVKDVGFMVEDKILDKLKDRFLKAAQEIKLAIIQDRPIIIRHHNDTDGYSSGFALERAILPLITDQHNSPKAAWEFFTRAPSQAPFYEIDDSIRDTANSLRDVAKFSNKMPLIIIADNGSSEEDLFAIKQGKVHGADFIVIDHHGFDKDVISDEVLVHINPFLVGGNGSAFSAGMLCAELARYINPDVQNISQIPAMAGFADKIDLENSSTMEKYLKIAESEGYSKNLLGDISLVIDYVSAKVRFMEVREYIEVLFGEPREKQKKLVSLMAPYIRELDKKGLEMGRIGSDVEELNGINFQSIKIEESFPGFGFFPKPGRSVSLLHDDYLNKSENKSLVTAGIMNTAITLRASDSANFSVHELIKYLKEKVPESFVSGGGHKNAGSINFLPNSKDKVVKELRNFISKD
jgi:archaea-specific RecJ-like exonuclease